MQKTVKTLKIIVVTLVALLLVPILSTTFTPDWAIANTADAGKVVPVASGENGDQNASSVLDTLPLKGRAPKTGYKRAQFGRAWADVDRNGCDTRNDILGRDLKDKKFRPRTRDCKVMSGTLDDPYTGNTIYFKQGKKTSQKVQIDHVVALSNAWQTGAQKLSAERREQMANDPYNLLAVDGKANQQKSDGDAATWLPKNKSYRCSYVSRQIGVKAKYDLWVTKAEKAAMQRVLTSCPAQTVPADDGPFAQNGAGVQSSAPASGAAEGSGNSGQSNNGNAGNVGSPQPVPAPAPAAPAVPQGGGDVYYQNCAAVRAAGKAPIYAGQPGYRAALDRDHDGVGCE
ncbi:DUF1524 domain-containing protein [Bifidobacterium sp. ESL0728]|uniref:GmrSD restriction endonuclease domain-containing protein n=1 Tax=Bifidobacterium sp. ESL0728 TaxID=2983220 RepID=UPI0023F820F5|nr:DUF1524 domain-containing protein [Bifidobacterium sp. ESL0728]WEV58879.1 DUF1524 domain-containing protein [Bifidobacterium sp. ESL0728]